MSSHGLANKQKNFENAITAGVNLCNKNGYKDFKAVLRALEAFAAGKKFEFSETKQNTAKYAGTQDALVQAEADKIVAELKMQFRTPGFKLWEGFTTDDARFMEAVLLTFEAGRFHDLGKMLFEMYEMVNEELKV